MALHLSRRAFLAGLGGLASLSVAAGLWKLHPWTSAFGANSPKATGGYVDYAGWILTPKDKELLTAQAQFNLLENTVFPGHDYDDKVTGTIEACAEWCLQETECQGFSFAKDTNPVPNLKNRCWLKNSTEIKPQVDPYFTSSRR